MGERRCYGECYPPMTVTERMASAAAGGLGVPKLSAEFRSKHGPPLDLGEKP